MQWPSRHCSAAKSTGQIPVTLSHMHLLCHVPWRLIWGSLALWFPVGFGQGKVPAQVPQMTVNITSQPQSCEPVPWNPLLLLQLLPGQAAKVTGAASDTALPTPGSHGCPSHSALTSYVHALPQPPVPLLNCLLLPVGVPARTPNTPWTDKGRGAGI